jgi:hypothetical protein
MHASLHAYMTPPPCYMHRASARALEAALYGTSHTHTPLLAPSACMCTRQPQVAAALDDQVVKPGGPVGAPSMVAKVWAGRGRAFGGGAYAGTLASYATYAGHVHP